jgi:glycosyltransferase involved in cell wall biosynthesis
MADATAIIVPMRCGGGIQTKILEAMAARVPVICTPFANQGLGASDNRHLLLANSAKEFAIRAAWVVNNPGPARNMALRAFEWVCQTHSRDAFAKGFVDAIGNALAQP